MPPVVVLFIFDGSPGTEGWIEELRLGQFRFQRSRGATGLRLDRTFCDVDVAINRLQVWQSPVAEQFRPSFIAMVVPDSEQWDPVIYLSILPQPSTCLSAASR